MLYHCVKFVDQIHFSCFWVIVDTQFVFDCDIGLGCGNLNFVKDTPSHLILSFCEVCLNSLYDLWVMADTGYVSDKPLTFDCDPDLGHGNQNFGYDTPSYFALPFCEV